MNPLAEVYLKAAHKRLAPGGNLPGFARGFWPDLARLAVEMALAEDTTLEPDWRPCMCVQGSWPEPAPRKPKSSGGKSSAEKAANTARLLAQLSGA